MKKHQVKPKDSGIKLMCVYHPNSGDPGVRHKITYRNKKEAKVAGSKFSPAQRAYHCVFCGFWHLTTTTKGG